MATFSLESLDPVCLFLSSSLFFLSLLSLLSFFTREIKKRDGRRQKNIIMSDLKQLSYSQLHHHRLALIITQTTWFHTSYDHQIVFVQRLVSVFFDIKGLKLSLI